MTHYVELTPELHELTVLRVQQLYKEVESLKALQNQWWELYQKAAEERDLLREEVVWFRKQVRQEGESCSCEVD
jgi:hypothetical protein